MRRVLDPALWLGARDCLPQIGRVGAAAWIHVQVLSGTGPLTRVAPPVSPVPVSWISRRQFSGWFSGGTGCERMKGRRWRTRLAAAKQISSASSESSSEDEDLDFDRPFDVVSAKHSQTALTAVSTSTVARLMMLIVFKACFCSSLPYVMSVCVFLDQDTRRSQIRDWEA